MSNDWDAWKKPKTGRPRVNKCKRGHVFNDKTRAFYTLPSGYVVQVCRVCRADQARVKYRRILLTFNKTDVC